MSKMDSSENEASRKQLCPFCSGTRQCHYCHGEGYRSRKRTWLLKRPAYLCPECKGTGTCPHCPPGTRE